MATCTTRSISASCKDKQYKEDHAKVTNLIFADIKNEKSQYLENTNFEEINALPLGNAIKIVML